MSARVPHHHLDDEFVAVRGERRRHDAISRIAEASLCCRTASALGEKAKLFAPSDNHTPECRMEARVALHRNNVRTACQNRVRTIYGKRSNIKLIDGGRY